MKKLVQFLRLPIEISEFERRYLERLNRIALLFFAAHIPVFVLIAYLNRTGPLYAAVLTSSVLAGPALARATVSNPRAVSIIHGISAMFMGGVLVHFGQGPLQIEMHFYFFALIAMCAVFGNPMVIIAAAITVAAHHFVVWLVLPSSVFHYEAAWWVVAVHAAFVVLESVAACFISRSFFDNVIGLEKIVEARTDALDAKNRDMRLLLDNMEQGILTIDPAGVIAPGRSRALDQWFGADAEGVSWFDYLAKLSPDFAASTRIGWVEVIDAIMPIELTIAQLPHKLMVDQKTLRIDYRPIGLEEPYARFLVVVTDVTSEVQREHAELERREAMAVFERVLVDRSGFETFFEEGTNVVEALTKGETTDESTVKRLIHTLKGNASLFGLFSVVTMCHELEDFIAQERALPNPPAYRPLVERWARLEADMRKLLGKGAQGVQLDDAQFAGLVRAIETQEPKPLLLKRVLGLPLEPTKKRLAQFAEQAHRIAGRLEKGDVDIRIEDNGVRLDPKRWGGFWSSFIHAVRNAIDHGIERPDVRVAEGKGPRGVIHLRTIEDDRKLVIEIADDGQGIDWNALNERAARLGVERTSSDELTKMLFADGVSTATTVTEFSGRGIGMGALMQATRALGGDLTIDSEKGHGTRVRMVFATSVLNGQAAMAPAA